MVVDESQELFLMRALEAARKAFFESLSNAGEDGAYYGFDFRGFGYGDDFSIVLFEASLGDRKAHLKVSEGNVE